MHSSIRQDSRPIRTVRLCHCPDAQCCSSLEQERPLGPSPGGHNLGRVCISPRRKACDFVAKCQKQASCQQKHNPLALHMASNGVRLPIVCHASRNPARVISKHCRPTAGSDPMYAQFFGCSIRFAAKNVVPSQLSLVQSANGLRQTESFPHLICCRACLAKLHCCRMRGTVTLCINHRRSLHPRMQACTHVTC